MTTFRNLGNSARVVSRLRACVCLALTLIVGIPISALAQESLRQATLLSTSHLSSWPTPQRDG
jgi:hypothetical protein